jgi:alkylglycerol monooxygenase
MNTSLILLAIPGFLVAMAIEWAVSRWTGRGLYHFEDTFGSLGCGVSQQVISLALKAWTIGVYVLLYDFRLFDLDAGSWAVWLFGLLAVDHQYYWFHRVSHRVSAIWATHAVHHQSEEYNLSTALRQGAFQGAQSAAFYWPLALLGLPPALFVLLSTLDTLYQFWIHTRLIGKLGPLEWVLNTPSHHRVHHGIDPAYIDKNYAGILIVWDRLYGTFEEERAEPHYGTVKPLESWNPIWAQVAEWARMIAWASGETTWSGRLRCFLAPPEWRPMRLGGPVVIGPVPPSRRKYRPPAGPRAYVGLHFALLLAATAGLLALHGVLPSIVAAASGAWILLGLGTLGGLAERRRWAGDFERLRLLASPLLGAALGATVGAVAAVAGLAAGALILALSWRAATP